MTIYTFLERYFSIQWDSLKKAKVRMWNINKMPLKVQLRSLLKTATSRFWFRLADERLYHWWCEAELKALFWARALVHSCPQIRFSPGHNYAWRKQRHRMLEDIEVLHGWTRVKKRGPSCEMASVARRLVVRQSWHGAWYKRVYMRFLILRGSRDVWILWSQPTLPLSVWCAPQDCFSSSFCAWFLYLDTEWFAADIVLVRCWWLVKGVARPTMLFVAQNHR